MKYADKNNIVLELNGVNNYGNSPILLASSHYCIGSMKLLIRYANKKNYFEFK